MKTIDEMIAVMERFKAGADIEWRDNSVESRPWQPATHPCWDWHDYDYRVKPVTKTLEIYIDPKRSAAEALEFGMFFLEPSGGAIKKILLSWEE